MRSPLHSTAAALFVATSLAVSLPPAAHAISGSLAAAYGASVSTQTTQTNWYDNTAGQVGLANGSELDAAYGYVSGGVLHLFLAGNLFSWTDAIGPFNIFDNLEVFLDTGAGGQNTLRADNPAVGSPMTLDLFAGLTFDTDFSPDYWLGFNGGGMYTTPQFLCSAHYAELPSGGGGAGYLLGQSIAGGPGTLSGGTNPNGILVTMDESNTGGVTAGCNAAAPGVVTTGIEWEIPLAAIGNPAGCIRVCAFVDYQLQHSSLVTNQVLGPLPPGTCNLGAPAGVNFANLAGSQYFEVCNGTTPARRSTWGSIKASYR